MPFARIIDPDARVYELRPGPHRVAYALHDGDYVLLHAWRKTSQSLDRHAAATSVRRLNELRAS